MKEHKRIYWQSIILNFLLYVMIASIMSSIFVRSGSVSKMIPLLFVSGFLYIPLTAFLNLTQFWCISNNKIRSGYSGRAYFLPVLLVGIYAISKSDYMSYAALLAQFFSSCIAFLLFKSVDIPKEENDEQGEIRIEKIF